MCLTKGYYKGDTIMNTSNITNYKPKDFAELLGVSVKTLQRWAGYCIYTSRILV